MFQTIILGILCIYFLRGVTISCQASRDILLLTSSQGEEFGGSPVHRSSKAPRGFVVENTVGERQKTQNLNHIDISRI